MPPQPAVKALASSAAAASLVVIYTSGHAITSCMQGCDGHYLHCTRLVGFKRAFKTCQSVSAAEQSLALPGIDLYRMEYYANEENAILRDSATELP